jgi:nitrogen fixation/metabolism regulation signal transduction histidine kinase
VSKGNIDDYMSLHRSDKNINELKKYFNSVIDWISSVFTDVEGEMCGLENITKRHIIPLRYQMR